MVTRKNNSNIVLDDFSPKRRQKDLTYIPTESDNLETEVFLLTKADRYKKHWISLMGNELYCYKSKEDTQHLLMHSLTGTFISELPESGNGSSHSSQLYPLKIIFMPQKSRTLFFKSQTERAHWLQRLSEVTGQTNVFQFYSVEHSIGKGQFGQVKLATHKSTGQKVAVKMMAKANMKIVEAH
jgi:hypothetical protein